MSYCLFQRQGAVHGEQLKYIFGVPLDVNSGYTESEAKISKTMIAYWSSYAAYG